MCGPETLVFESAKAGRGAATAKPKTARPATARESICMTTPFPECARRGCRHKRGLRPDLDGLVAAWRACGGRIVARLARRFGRRIDEEVAREVALGRGGRERHDHL